MHKPFLCTCLCLLSSLPVAHAAGTVEVAWITPANYSDAGRGSFERERTLQALGLQLRQLGSLLPDGQTLKLEVTELDLAGELRPWHGQDIRVMRGRADWPQMSLRYVLSADGRTLKAGEAQLSDMAYLGHGARDDGAFEKRMVADWIKRSLVAPQSLQ